MRISKEYSFAAAHRLWVENWNEEKNVKVFGKCARPHGHNYKIIVEVGDHVNESTGMIMNYYALDEIVKNHILQKWDHHDLNDYLQLPTAENLVFEAWKRLVPHLPTGVFIRRLTIKETDKTTATMVK